MIAPTGVCMDISARIHSRPGRHDVELSTNGAAHALPIAARASGPGSATNGGELLVAALATCFCNDLYREAARLGVAIDGCEVTAVARFAGIGLPAGSIQYSARVDSPASPDRIELLLAETDRLAEVHNTLRAGCDVRRVPWHETGESA